MVKGLDRKLLGFYGNRADSKDLFRSRSCPHWSESVKAARPPNSPSAAPGADRAAGAPAPWFKLRYLTSRVDQIMHVHR